MMMKRVITALLVWVQVALPVSGWGATTETFYVAQTQQGDGAGTACYYAKPATFFNNAANWAAVVSADGKIGPDDEVKLCDDGGSFVQLSTKNTGLVGYPITISVASGESVTVDNGFANNSAFYIGADDDYIVIDADKLIVKNAIQSGYRIDSSDYITINNPKIETCRLDAIRAISSQHVTINYPIITGIDSVATVYGINFITSPYGIVTYPYIHDNGAASATDVRGINYGDGSNSGQVWYARLVDNLTVGGDGSGVEIFDSSLVYVTKSEISGSNAGIEAKSNDDTTYPLSSDGLTVTDTYIHSVVGGILYGEWPEDGTGAESENGTFYNNTIVATSIGFDIHSPNQTLKNNIVVMDATGFVYAYRFLNMSEADVATVDMDYNLTYLPGLNNQYARISSIDANYETLAAWQTYSTKDASSLSTDPLLDSAGRPRLKSLYDAGTAHDNNIYCGSGEPIGAYELCKGVSMPPPLWFLGTPDSYSLGGGRVHASLVWNDALTWNDSNTWAD